jgi:hypothetical protein
MAKHLLAVDSNFKRTYRDEKCADAGLLARPRIAGDQ